MRATCTAHIIRLRNNVDVVEFTLLFSMQFSPAVYCFFCLGPNVFLCNIISITLNLCSSRRVRDLSFTLIQNKCKITVVNILFVTLLDRGQTVHRQSTYFERNGISKERVYPLHDYLLWCHPHRK